YPAYSVCETPAHGNGFEAFDLTTQIAAIIGTQTGVSVTFYPSLLDAQNNTGAITAAAAAAYVNTVPNVQTLGIRVSSTTATGCFAISTIDIRVEPLPVLAPIPALHFCDANNDGVGSFDLATLLTSLAAQYPGYSGFSIHETQTDAENNVNALGSPYSNIDLWNQTVYIHVNSNTVNCSNVFTLNLIVDPTPVATTPQDYHVCDDNTDGISVFNLTTLDAQVLGTLNPALYTVSYYLTLADAQAGTAAIGSATTFNNTVANHQTIYAAVITTATGCRNTAVVELYVDPIPTATQPAYAPYSVCETPAYGIGFEAFNLTSQIPTIIGTQTGVSVTFYPSLLDAQNNTAAITNPAAYVNTPAFVQTLGIRVSATTSTGCFAISTMDIRVEPLPVLAPLTALHYCDPNNDGVGVFDLATLQATLAAQYPTYSGFTIHETPTDAITGANPLVSPYNNIDLWNQTVYVHVNAATAACNAYFPLNLVVDPTPVASIPQPYHVCDNDADGISVFNLTTLDTQVLGTLNPALYTVSYYLTLADAQAGTAAIGSASTFSNTVINHQTIYAAVITNATGCRNTAVVELYVDPLPLATQPAYAPFSICETPAYGIGFEAFNLQSHAQALLLGQTGVGVTFYPSLLDAQNNTNAIATPAAYVNTNPFVQTLGVRLTSTSATACYVISTMDIRVQPLPVLIPPTGPFVACDTNQDGITQFDLCTTITPVVDPNLSYIITYYETLTDAQTGLVVNQLPCLYTNINSSFVQFIYVRAQDPITGCFTVMQVELNVDPSPVMPTLPTMAMCDYDNNNQNGCFTFDLTTQSAAILAAQAPGSYTVSYYLTQADASHSPMGTFPIVNASSYYTCTGQIIWVRVENNTTHCFAVGSFALTVNAPIVLVTPAPLKVCDNDTAPNDLHTTFDLTLENDSITGVVGSTGFTVNYYNHFVLPMPVNGVVLPPATLITNPATYVNFQNSVETLLVEVINNATGCKGYTTLTIRVLPVPTPNTNPTTLPAECETTTGSGVAVFNLTTNANYIMNNDPNVVLHYYPTHADMVAHTNEIMTPATATVGDPTIAGTTINQVQYVYIAVTSNIFIDSDGYNCYVEVKQGFIVNPLPVVASIPNYQICQDLATNNGIATFDLTSQITALLVGNSTTPVSTYSVAFYTTNPPTAASLITNPTAYINTASPNSQTIYVVVTNDITHCTSAVGQFNIVVNPKPVLGIVMLDYATCDMDGTNDGYHNYPQNPTSTLTGLAGYVNDLLGPTQQTGFTVYFYDNQADALAGTVANAITNLATYPVHSNMYWVRIENDVTHCFILDSFETIIEQLPQPKIVTSLDNHVMCVDFTNNQVVRPLTLTIVDTTAYLDYDNNPATYPTPTQITPAPTYLYQWYVDGVAITGATAATYSPPASTTGAIRNYTVVMTSTTLVPAGGCASSTCAPFPVIQSGQAVAIGNNGGYTITNAFADNQTITVTVDGWGAPDYQYSLDDGAPQVSPVFSNVTLGQHTITVWDIKGGTMSCDPLVIENVQTIDYPHYFTPNGDGINDYWNIVGLYNQPNAKIYIFDRFGKLIKQISSQSEGWDGTFNGNTLPATDYWFTVDYSEASALKQFKAHFSLKR
ncbi:T9SS type B sorting domain-containing protein, partial [Flavobacterium sp. SUN046]|uniref:T9SS type B sorting domain-containing protein n=1 Tax=Flavobacterium sp. SUN046 TaxID=3002440 RepID=UPI002DB6AF06